MTDAHQTIRLGQGGARQRLRVEQLQLKVIDGPDKGRSIPLDPPQVRVGTGPENELSLTDPSVSRAHFTVKLEGATAVLVDRGSTNGTRVNGVLAREAVLERGNRITAGGTTIELRLSATDLAVLPAESDRFHGLIGASPAMRELFGYLSVVAQVPLTVILQGETGCGKELVARALHDASPRAAKPFVVFDCATADPSLVGASLFGHAAGAFTGAVGSRKGAFQSAEGGTLFLDEIGELPLDLQPRLLRALERGEVQPLGSDAPAKVDVRAVCATHRNLAQMAQEGKFREDLLHRLAGVTLILPALRERREDIPLIARHFLQAIRPGAEFAHDALEILVSSPWPGNVRELKNAVERSGALAKTPRITAADLLLGPVRPGGTTPNPDSTGALGSLVGQMEADAIRRALKEAGGNKSEAARILGIARTTLRRKMTEHGIPEE